MAEMFTLAQRVRRALGERTTLPVRVVETDNAVRLVSMTRDRRRLTVRMSRALEPLGAGAVDALCDFALERPGARAQLKALISSLAPPERRRRPRQPRLAPRGTVHDLEALLALEARWFLGGELALPVTYGPRVKVRRGQRSIRLGSYSVANSVIRIHPALDDPRVPDWFVGFVLFHELLHHHLGIDESGPRRKVHPKAFRDLERTHPRFDDAKALELELVPMLLGRGRRSTR